MRTQNALHMTIDEYMDILKTATIAVYYSTEADRERLCHPEDLAINVEVVNETIGSALGNLLRTRSPRS